MDNIILRTLTYKSINPDPYHPDKTIQELIKSNRLRYLRYIYYRYDKITFIPEILEIIGITLDLSINKPGTSLYMARKNQPKKPKLKPYDKNKDRIEFSKRNLQRLNQGHK